ncbi:hypothetical protein JYT87_01710 [Nitrospira defluvii]|nr:hypothetical protein [Nitrospira defluvii]
MVFTTTPVEDFNDHPWARRKVSVSNNDPMPNVKKIEVIIITKDTNGDDKTLVALMALKSQ